MNLRIASVVAGVLGTALSYQYIFAAWLFAQNGRFYPANLLEVIILTIQLVKLVTILSIKRLRQMKLTNILDVWAVEILAVPLLIALSVTRGGPIYISLAGELFLAWGSAVLLVFPVFAIYKVTTVVLKGVSLTTLLPSATSVFSLLALLIAALSQQSVSSAGLSGLAKTIPVAVKAMATTTPQAVYITGALVYLSLIIYSVARPDQDIFNQIDLILGFSLLGTIAALGWAFLAQTTESAFFDFGIPSLAFATIVWLIARGK